MNLHRTDSISQWEKTDQEKWNFWQKLAAETNGSVTLGNILSVAGLAIVASGAKDLYRGNAVRGISKIAIGRVFDVLDGVAAEYTKTKSPLGEAIDAVIDKVEVAMVYPVLKKQELVPEPILRKFRNQQICNASLTTIAKLRKREIHPQKEGKLSTAKLWGSTVLYIIAKHIEAQEPVISTVLDISAQELALSTIELGNSAIIGYLCDAFALDTPELNLPLAT